MADDNDDRERGDKIVADLNDKAGNILGSSLAGPLGGFVLGKVFVALGEWMKSDRDNHPDYPYSPM